MPLSSSLRGVWNPSFHASRMQLQVAPKRHVSAEKVVTKIPASRGGACRLLILVFHLSSRKEAGSCEA